MSCLQTGWDDVAERGDVISLFKMHVWVCCNVIPLAAPRFTCRLNLFDHGRLKCNYILLNKLWISHLPLERSSVKGGNKMRNKVGNEVRRRAFVREHDLQELPRKPWLHTWNSFTFSEICLFTFLMSIRWEDVCTANMKLQPDSLA